MSNITSEAIPPHTLAQCDSGQLNRDAQPIANCGLFTSKLSETSDYWKQSAISRADVTIAIFFGLVAFAARLPLILNGASTLHSDEAIVGLMAQDICDGKQFPIYFYGQRYMGALEAYVVAFMRCLFSDPSISLRMGPAIVFFGLVATQYLMLMRWFGRKPAIAGTLSLIISSPMVAQWTIAARGGYVEVFLVGTWLWWLYGEWFVAQCETSKRQKFVFGFLCGLGFWINPITCVFVAPIFFHAALMLCSRNEVCCRSYQSFVARHEKIARHPFWTLSLALGAIALINFVGTVKVTNTGVQTATGFGIIPPTLVKVGLLAACAGGVTLCVVTSIWSSIRRILNSSAAIIFGSLVGSSPAIYYIASRSIAGIGLEESVPMGIRPFWTIDDTAYWLVQGLPLLLGSTAKPFLSVSLVGQNYAWRDTPALIEAVSTCGTWLVVGGLMGMMLLLVTAGGREILSFLRLEPRLYSPSLFLILSSVLFLAAYLLSALVFDISSTRYLLPLAIVIPGLFAATLATQFQRTGWLLFAPIVVCWGVGQVSLWACLGEPHPMQAVARATAREHIAVAVAEFQDAHLLSFFSEQRTKVREFNPFWPRLKHFEKLQSPDSPHIYIVPIGEPAWSTRWPGPGPAPPETRRQLKRQLEEWQRLNPTCEIRRTALTADFEIWCLPRAIDFPNAPSTIGSSSFVEESHREAN